jgi:hypothetical protein
MAIAIVHIEKKHRLVVEATAEELLALRAILQNPQNVYEPEPAHQIRKAIFAAIEQDL